MPMFYTAKGFLNAVAQGDETTVDRYLSKGDVSKWLRVTDNERQGETALHLAVRSDNVKLIQKFIALGVDVEEKTRHGTTALGLAIERSQLRSATALIEAGADIKATTVYGSLMETAVKRGWQEGFELLLAHKADSSGKLLKAAI
jgi:serine/threonine-protein phosphatase 6 regulatory ankyrin repeat subunit A